MRFFALAALESLLALRRSIAIALAITLGLAIGQARAGGDTGYPKDVFAVTAASGNVAAAAATATIAAAAGRRNFLCGFTMTSTGSTAAAVVNPTVTGLMSTTHTYVYASVAGATLANQPLVVTFSPCIPASADGVAITVTLPSLGAGNTNAATTAWGYRN